MPNDFDSLAKDFKNALGNATKQFDTLVGLVKSKQQEIDLLVKLHQNADQLTEALNRVAPERLLSEYRLPDTAAATIAANT